MRNQKPRTDKSDWSVQTSYALNGGSDPGQMRNSWVQLGVR